MFVPALLEKSTISILPAEKQGLFAPDTPLGVGQYLQTHEPPNTGVLLNNQAWGGYLEWRLGDQYRTLLDGRTQVFSPEFWQAAYFSTPQQRQRFLSAVPADAAIVPARNSLFRESLSELGWTVAYSDQRAAGAAAGGLAATDAVGEQDARQRSDLRQRIARFSPSTPALGPA